MTSSIIITIIIKLCKEIGCDGKGALPGFSMQAVSDQRPESGEGREIRKKKTQQTNKIMLVIISAVQKCQRERIESF